MPAPSRHCGWLVAALVCAAGVRGYFYSGSCDSVSDCRCCDISAGREAIFPTYIRGGWARVNYCCRDVIPIVRRSRARYRWGITAGCLSHSRPGEPRDQQGFAYPVTTLILRCRLPCNCTILHLCRCGGPLLLIAVSCGRAHADLGAVFGMAKFIPCANCGGSQHALGSLAVMPGLKLEQMSLLVAGFIAIAILLLIRDYQVGAGIMLALASMKPQLVVLLLVWVGIWALGDPRRRYRWAVSFLVAMAIQIAAGEWYLPHWIPRFWQAAREYRTYTAAISACWAAWFRTVAGQDPGSSGLRSLDETLLERTLPGSQHERFLREPPAWFWRSRFYSCPLTRFTIRYFLIQPALLVLFEGRHALWRKSAASRLLLLTVAVLVAWPWITSVVLAGLSFILPQARVERYWAVPFLDGAGHPGGEWRL